MKSLWALAALALMLGGVSGCSSSDDSDSQSAAVARASSGPEILLAPQIHSGTRYWDTLGFQNDPSFDGVIAVGRATPDGEAEEIVMVERRTGAIAYLTAEGFEGNWDKTRNELGDVSDRLEIMAGDFYPTGTRVASFNGYVKDHACGIRIIALSLAVVGAVVALDLAVAAAPAVIATIETQGLREAAMAAARAGIQSPRVRTLIGFKVAKFGVKAWLIFSETGQQLTAPVREAFSDVIHAECTTPGTGDDALVLLGP